MSTDRITKAIEAISKEMAETEYKLDEPMRNHTSFRIGGQVRAMFFPGNEEKLIGICRLLRRFDVMPLIIGNGTNLLVDDNKPLEIVVVKTTGVDYAQQTGAAEIKAGAGISLSKLAEFARDRGLSGLEFAHGIPGSLGGAVSMNAGAYGREMKDIVKISGAYSYDAGLIAVNTEEHRFSYRSSRFLNSNDIVLFSVLTLEKADKDSITSNVEQLYARRKESQPLELPSAGSTFKRPENGFAGKLIEQAGLKGFSVGGARVSDKHSGFVVNTGGATFSDVMAVIGFIQETVFQHSGIELTPEIRIIKGE